MTKHEMSAFPLMVRKGEDDDADAIVQKAVADLVKPLTDAVKGVTERLDKIEGDDTETKMADRLDKIEKKVNRAKGEGDDTTEGGAQARKAFAAYLAKGNNTPADELKTLVVSSDPQGGYLAPAEMSTEFIRELVEFSPIRSVASVRTTGSPSVDYPARTGGTAAKWKGETEAQEGSQPSFGQKSVTIHELNTFVDISNQLLADSAGMAEAEVRSALAEDFGQKEAQAFLNGDGAGKPHGLMKHADIAITVNGHATNLSADKLIELLYAVPATYRNLGAWAMNGTTLGKVRTLKDGDGRFLWQPSYAAGQPETLLGRPVVEMIDMPDLASGAEPIIYGDWSGYRIVDRLALSVLSNPYLLATNGVTRIHATRRTGGAVLQPAKFRKLKMTA